MPEDQLLSRDDKVALKRAVLAGQRDSLPPVVTHNLVDDKRDEVRSCCSVLVVQRRFDCARWQSTVHV